ncbi:MAG: hypothetical protein E6G56_11300 [Actinobacteria bacterium]|nr:MAG: hypothetical protein E6G56_11300 [Actinomycetota bacterium]
MSAPRGLRLPAALACATFALAAAGVAAASAQGTGGTGGSSSPPPGTGGSSTGPAPAPPPPPPPLRPSADPLLGAVDRAQITGVLDATRAASYRSIYHSALSTAARVRGSRRTEMTAVIRITRSIAIRGLLTPSRLALIYLTLQRNAQWWSRRGSPAPGDDSTIVARGSALTGGGTDVPTAIAAGEPDTAGRHCRALGARISRVVFTGSGVVFEYYPGMGLQLQVNGTFGAADALAHQGTPSSLERARRLLDEMLPLISSRDGLATWEYAFPFEAGKPPWTSALSQGTAIEAYTTVAAKLHRPDYLAVARQLAGILGRRAPGGVELGLGRDGDWFLLYSFARDEVVLNAHLDAMVGLTDLASATHDPKVAALAAKGMRATRRRIHLFDTGSWSRYQLGGPPADLNYHVLNRDLAGALCQRTRDNVVCGAWRRFTRELDARCPRTGSSGSTARSGAGARARRPRRLPAPGRAARAA